MVKKGPREKCPKQAHKLTRFIHTSIQIKQTMLHN